MPHTLPIARAFGVVLLAGCLLLAGCSRPTGTLSGKVTYMNKSLKGGTVTFVSAEGRQSYSADIKEDGTYFVMSITGGDYKVCVDTSHLKPPSAAGGYTGSGGKSAPPAPAAGDKKGAAPPPGAALPEGYTPSNPSEANAAANAKKYVQIPESYKDADKTDLKLTVTGGPQTFDIPLK